MNASKPQSRPRVAIVREALTEPSAIEAFESVWAELGDNQRARFALFRQNEQLLKQAEDFESERAAMHAEVARLVEQLEAYEKALRDIVHLPDETEAYSYADACVNIARAALNPAKEREDSNLEVQA